MIIKENFSLLDLNTFGIDVKTKRFIDISDESDVFELTKLEFIQKEPLLIIGEGSNILFTEDFKGTVVKINTKGIEISKDSSGVYVEAKAGEIWDDLVAFCVENNLYGLENLSFIPGNVGSSPIQNIGAYGVELKDTFYELKALDLQKGNIKIFNHESCCFGYRKSIFKNEFKGRFIILSVVFCLKIESSFNTEYGAIKKELQKLGDDSIDLNTMREVIGRIRDSKLPDPEDIGNGGSFFKNPEVSEAEHNILKSNHPDVVSYPLANGKYKIAAGWMIENCGWKGYRKGDAGVHNKQALILVNHGKASGKEIVCLAEKIIESVKNKFAIKISPEINII